MKKRSGPQGDRSAPFAQGGGGKENQRGLANAAKERGGLSVEGARASRKLVALLGLALTVATIAVYAEVCHYGFIEYDDNSYVYDNATVKAGLTASGVAWAFSTFNSANWHPVTWLSHMLDSQVVGPTPGAYHVVNVGFHVASALLLFAAFVRMTRRPWRSAIVAGIFAVHPLHVESVVWIAERKDVLSAFFAAVTLLLYIRYAQAPTVRRYALVAVAFALGLMSKSMLVTLPFVLVLVDIWPLGRLGWPPPWKTLRSRLWEKAPLFAMSAAVSVVTFIAQQSGGAVSGLTRLPLSDRLATAATAYLGYIGMAVWPARLGVLYPYRAYPAADVIGAVVVLVAVTIGVFVWGRRRPYVLVGWLWYVGMLVPVIGIVQVGAQSMADRYTYLPLVGLSAAIVWLAADLVEGRRILMRAAGAVALAALVALGAEAHRQTGYWRTSQALFERTLAVTSRNYVMHKSLAVVFDGEGKAEEAKAHYLEALAIKPDFAEAHNGLGMILDREGKRDEAMAHYREALGAKGDLAEAHNNIGVVLEREGKIDEAAAEYGKAITLRGDFADARKNLAVLLAREGKSEEAAAQYRQALAARPDYAEAHNNLGVILAGGGRNEEAMEHYRQALAAKGDYAEAHANLGHELLRLGKLDEALVHLAKAVEKDPKLAGAHADLGTILAAQGKFEQARLQLEESLRLAPGQQSVHSNLGFVLGRLGRLDEAIAECREALRLKGDSVDAHYNLAMALAAKGQRAEAEEELSRVLALDPNHANARRALDALQESR